MSANGDVTLAKSATTPADPSTGVINAVEEAAAILGEPLRRILADTTHFVHGCTIGTNAMIERTGVRTGLITTQGFEDIIFIGKVLQKNAGLSERELIHLSQLNKPEPLVDRQLVIGVPERIDCDGEVLAPLDVDAVRAAADRLAAAGVRAIAVCLLWSFRNPQHELLVQKIVRERHPQIHVTISSEACPILGEYERCITTVLGCYLGPKVTDYLQRLEDNLSDLGYKFPLMVMQAVGGITTAQDVKENAIATLDSGPVGAALGAKFYGASQDHPNIICTDVGGTTFDVSLVHNSEPEIDDWPVLDRFTLRLPKLRIKSIGAGGGSIAWLDETGVLRVGPRSAGAIPGPACYGRGGMSPTVTDADLVLGYLSADSFLGGRMHLDVDRARKALASVGGPLGMSEVEVAHGIFRLINAHMADLIRKCTVESGYDPRDFVLVACGGAGPTHAAYYALDVEAKSIYVTPTSTVFSAFGMLTTPMLHLAEESVAYETPLSAEQLDLIKTKLARLKTRLVERFAAEGIDTAKVKWRPLALVRYKLQRHSLQVEVPLDGLPNEAFLRNAFDQKYAATYGEGTGYREASIEIIVLRMEGTFRDFQPILRKLPEADQRNPAAAMKARRPAYFPEAGGFTDTPIYAGERLLFGHVLQGPALVERMGDTALIPPGFSGRVDVFGNISIASHRNHGSDYV